jgi:hypothetical protein
MFSEKEREDFILSEKGRPIKGLPFFIRLRLITLLLVVGMICKVNRAAAL